jgi:uncharacterized DUF497 family protein
MGLGQSAADLTRHRISFDTAVTGSTIRCPRCSTILAHSIGEQRLITIGYSSRERLLVVSHSERRDTIRISVHDAPPRKRGNTMKRETGNRDDEMRSEYRFDYSKAVRGKNYRRLLKAGANVVVLEPDIAKFFRIQQQSTTRYVLCLR